MMWKMNTKRMMKKEQSLSNPKSYAAIQKHLEECGFEDVGGDFTYIPNDMKEVTPEQRETLDKMIERLEEFDDVQTVYTNMQPEEGE